MTVKVKKRYYITFNYPGHFFGESYTLESMVKKSIKQIFKLSEIEGAYAFTISEQEVVIMNGKTYKGNHKDNGIRYFIDATLYNQGDIEKLFPDKEILLSNMKCNKYDYVVKTNCGWYVPFEVNDIIIKSSDYK